MKPKILVTRKMTDEAEKKLAESFDATFNKEDKPKQKRMEPIRL